MSRSRSFVPALLAAVALVLGACAPDQPEPAPEPVRDPYPVDTALPSVDLSERWLPRSLEELDVVDPGWDGEPQHADGIYLGPGERDGLVEFTAVGVHGDVLWAVQRPAGHEGFALTTDDQGRALAVLTDVTETDGGTTATAYDLHTGEQLWGPVEVPGPHRGPGLVFGTSADASDELLALDPGTGGAAASADTGQGRVVGEFHGTVLVADTDSLVARDSGDDRELWRIAAADQGWDASTLAAPTGPSPVDGMTLLTTSDSTGALVDLRDGTVVSDTAQDAWLDHATGTLVIFDGTGLHAFDPAHELLWQLTVGPDTSVEAVGGVFVYVREDDAVRAHNVVTGAVAEAYDPQGQGPIVVPAHLTVRGAGLLPVDGRLLVATLPEEPGMPDNAPGG